MRTNDGMHKEPANTRVGAVVLAAGMSTRMGTSKALLPWGSRPMIGHVIEMLASAGGITSVVVVTGHQAEQVGTAVAGDGVRCVLNPDHAAGGMLSSFQCGISAMAGEVDTLALVLGDQPAVRAETLRQLCDAWQRSGARLIIPTYEGQRGHPVLFAAALWSDILALRPPQTLRDLVHGQLPGALLHPVEDPGVLGDVDTPEDYRHAIAQWEQERT